MPNDTPITDEAYAKVCHFANEEEATEACATMRDKCREFERQLTSTRNEVVRLNGLLRVAHTERNDAIAKTRVLTG